MNEKGYVALVALGIAVNMFGFGISWSAVVRHVGIEHNPYARFSVPYAIFSILAIVFAAIAICLVQEAPAMRNTVFGAVVGMLSGDGACDITQLFPQILGSSVLDSFANAVFVASLTPATVALLEVRRMKCLYDRLSLQV